MRTLLALVACLIATTAAVYVLPSRKLGQGVQEDRPKRCCLPDNWQAYITESISYETGPGNMQVLFEYAVKTNEKLNAFRMIDRFTHQVISRVVLDFNTNMMYNITDGDCVKSVKPSWFEPVMKCLPPQAEYVGRYFVGGVEDDVVAYYWRAHNLTKLITYVEIAFSQSCYPIFESITFNAGVPMHIDSNFANMANKIVTPEIFDVPPSCKNNVPKQIPGEPLHHPKTSLA